MLTVLRHYMSLQQAESVTTASVI